MVQLLVSVRSAVEAETAIAGGADWIDIKEPSRGSLGRADEATATEIIQYVGGRRPISMALGELLDHPPVQALAHSGLMKVGLAGSAAENWQACLRALIEKTIPGRVVPVAYADCLDARSPTPRDVARFAVDHGCPGFLIDTWQKAGRTLLDWDSVAQLAELAEICHRANILFAVAGSLKLSQLDQVLAAGPDVIAVRGAACRDGDRGAVVDGSRVQELAAACHASPKFTIRTERNRPARVGK